MSDISKKRGKKIFAICLFIVLVVIMLLIFIVPCVLRDKREKDQVKETVSEFLDRYQTCDPSASELLAGTGDIEMTYNGISASFADKMSYTINSCEKKSDDHYAVDIETETIDFKSLFTESYDQAIESYGDENVSEHLLDIMQRSIDSGNYDTKKISTVLSVLKINGKFKIQMDTSLSNALSGGINEYLESLTGGV